MKFSELKNNWEKLGENDPYWAVLTNPEKVGGKWDKPQFYKTGEVEIEITIKQLTHFNFNQFEKALDFGCGVGRLTLPLGNYFNQVVGVDISKTMIHEAKKQNNLPTKISFQVNTKPDLSQFQDESFDFIYSSITLQHIDPKLSLIYIKDFFRLLKPGGVLIFNLPDSPPFHIKFLIKIIGKKNINKLRQKLTGNKGFMEMNWVKKEIIEKLVHGFSQLKLLKIIDDKSAGKNWKGYRYIIQKLKP